MSLGSRCSAWLPTKITMTYAVSNSIHCPRENPTLTQNICNIWNTWIIYIYTLQNLGAWFNVEKYFHCWGYDLLCTYLILYMKTKTCLFLSNFDQSRYSELARNDMNKFAYKAMKLNRKAGEQSPRLYDLSFPT